MAVGLIVAIVVVLLVVGVLVMLPRMRAKAEQQKAERELQSRRAAVADRHRGEATRREREAEMAEQKARIAQQEAEKGRAEAQLEHERAKLHDRGMADDELIADHERDRFAGVTDVDGDGSTTDDRARRDMGRDDDRDGVDDRRETETTPRAATDDGTSADYEQGREDERRFERSRLTDDVRESERQ